MLPIMLLHSQPSKIYVKNPLIHLVYNLVPTGFPANWIEGFFFSLIKKILRIMGLTLDLL